MPNTLETPPARRPFAAKYEHRGWGITLVAIGALGIFTFEISSIIVSLGLIAWGIYLLRGRGMDPAKAAKRAAESAKQAEAAAAQAQLNPAAPAPSMAAATSALADAHGAAALVAYRNLEATARAIHPEDPQQALEAALRSIGFDPAILNVPRLGSIPALGGTTPLEVFREWIIFGQHAYDIDASTRGQVYVDGSIEVTSNLVPHGKKAVVVDTQHDLRTAHLQFVSSEWSLPIPISMDQVPESRRIVEQVAAYVETIKPQAATSADITSMVQAILNNSGLPPAERIRQLSNLRYERLLSDAEFASAKARILGDQDR